jgi:hypothetical protein
LWDFQSTVITIGLKIPKSGQQYIAMIGICASVSTVSFIFAKESFAACTFSKIFRVSLKG